MMSTGWFCDTRPVIAVAFVITGSENFPNPIIYETPVPICGCLVGLVLSMGVYFLIQKGTLEINGEGYAQNYPRVKKALDEG